MSITSTTIVEIETTDDLIEVEVMWEFSDSDAGRLSGPPEDCYPGSDPELQACAIHLDGKVNADGECWLIEQIGSKGFAAEMERALENADYDDGSDYSDYLYERMRDERMERGE